MFGVVPKTLWEKKAPADERNRITLAMRPLIVRGARTMIIDAGLGDKENAKFHDIYGVDRARHLDHTLAEAGLALDDIDIVLATPPAFRSRRRLHRRATRTAASGRVSRARSTSSGAASGRTRRTRTSATAPATCRTIIVPLAEAGVLQLVDDDQTIMPGVKVRRTGGHTMHHQMVMIESGGKTAAFVADLIPTTAHLPDAVDHGLRPVSDGHAGGEEGVRAGSRSSSEMLVFFEHDPSIAAGLHPRAGRQAPGRSGCS